uniref:Uncharacterized protein n=1 Tax=Erpetoichthys calabaricus TaxID=27687 RepID=A0A8C4TDQ5_ERPCA
VQSSLCQTQEDSWCLNKVLVSRGYFIFDKFSKIPNLPFLTLSFWSFDPAAFVLIIVLTCCSDIRRRVPLNFVFLILFVIIFPFLFFFFHSFFQADEVMWAVAATGIVCFSLSIFALQTKWDFTTLSGIIWVFLWTLIASGILFAIIRSRWLSIVYAGSGTLIFSIYLVIDTQMMLGGKHRYSIDPEEYVFAALNLYLDIINLFLFILQIIGLSK